jgi:3-oxoacyl-[acyl-carrier-protein] synthase II
MTKCEVVISGIGLVTPLGNDTLTTWQNLIAGRSGTSLITDRFNFENYPCKVAGFVKNEQAYLDRVLSSKDQNHTGRFIHLGLIAADHALKDANLSVNFPEQRERFGAYIGVGVGGLGEMERYVHDYASGGPKKVSPFAIPSLISNEAAGWISIKWDLQGPSSVITNACSSSSDAVGMAFRLIRDGYADYMIAGGTESCAIPITVVAFGNMRALSTWDGDPAKSSRPFDALRSGFVMSEGAAMLILERKDLALKRGARIYAEIIGYGATSDAHHITAIHPEGRGAVNAINLALSDAKISPEQVGYINAHGTGTKMNDIAETRALKKVFGPHICPQNSKHIFVSSTKSMTGHMLGATGAAEAAFCALALKEQMLPPTINLDNPDPECDLDYVPMVSREVNIRYAISNSFGFGGGSTVLVFKKSDFV